MGAIHFSLDAGLLAFLKEQLPLEVFVETGTFTGDTLRLAAKFFGECHSVEKSPHYFEAARKNFAGAPGVRVYLEDSPAFLARHDFRGRAVLFWLDAHWCQAGETAGQPAQSPLLGELAALQSLHEHSVVLIDDARYYLCAPPRPHECGEWPDFHSVATGLLSLSSRHRLMVLNDVIIFYPSGLRAALQEFAHLHGVDWLSLTNEWRDWRERRARRFPSPNFFRHQWRRVFKNRSGHAAD
jgi:hypothetical protein